MLRADVVVVGTSIDSHVDRVLAQLPSTLVVARVDVDLFPKSTALSLQDLASDGPRLTFERDGEAYLIDRPGTVWFRRLGKPGLVDNLDPVYRLFALAEADHVLESILTLMRPKLWVNEYWACRRAAVKPHQYQAASRAGLSIPSTLVTNSAALARPWLSENPDVIAKTLSSPVIVSTDDVRGFSFTHIVDDSDLQSVEQVSVTPVQFQESIVPKYEVRVSSIGGRHFAVRIDLNVSKSDGIRDWRSERIVTSYSWMQLPPEVERSLDALLGELGLTYGASDFIVDEDGQFIFLETNPHGAWLWLEDTLGDDKITRDVASFIASGC